MPSLPFWLVGEAHGCVVRWRERPPLAPLAPDEVELPQSGEAWDLQITSVRPKPDWRSLVKIEYNGLCREKHRKRSGCGGNPSGRTGDALRLGVFFGVYRGTIYSNGTACRRLPSRSQSPPTINVGGDQIPKALG